MTRTDEIAESGLAVKREVSIGDPGIQGEQNDRCVDSPDERLREEIGLDSRPHRSRGVEPIDGGAIVR
jgi:hypothetical protein